MKRFLFLFVMLSLVLDLPANQAVAKPPFLPPEVLCNIIILLPHHKRLEFLGLCQGMNRFMMGQRDDSISSAEESLKSLKEKSPSTFQKLLKHFLRGFSHLTFSRLYFATSQEDVAETKQWLSDFLNAIPPFEIQDQASKKEASNHFQSAYQAAQILIDLARLLKVSKQLTTTSAWYF